MSCRAGVCTVDFMTTTAGTTQGFGFSRATERGLAARRERRIASIVLAVASGAAALLFVVPSPSPAPKSTAPTTTPTATTIPAPVRAHGSISHPTRLRDGTVHGCEGISHC
jgi:hypothetical protein